VDPFEIDFAESVEEHLDALTARDRKAVLDGIFRSLRFEPTSITRSRKPMRPNPLGSWELRIGDLRVDYRVKEDPRRVVEVAAVGVKKRNEIWIAGEKVDL
jgi:mRNA-degrading endonuclease RelE of RelBE toxin-antitoxin system